jgi:hypothetical protein
VPVGFSTGALAAGDVDAGVTLARRLAPGIIELSALDEAELDSVELAARAQRLTGTWSRISVHGPAKNRALPEDVLVTRMAGLRLDVVMHPDVLEDVCAWQPLGSRLLIENNDERKSFGGSVADLDALFLAVPDARLCLDVSHALSVGGLAHVRTLASRYASRLAQMHVGCGGGRAVGAVLEPDLLEAVSLVSSWSQVPVPVIVERSACSDTPDGLAAFAAMVVACVKHADGQRPQGL